MKRQYYGRINPESNLSAQINTQCDIVNHPEGLTDAVFSHLEALRGVSPKVHLLCGIMFANGLRVSEALSLSWSNHIGGYQFKIKGLKGSGDRLVNLGEFQRLLGSPSSGVGLLFPELDRFYVYRCLKKIGFGYFLVDSNRQAVTHAFRHLYVQNLREHKIEDSSIKTIIGHKNESNTKRYGRGKKKGASN